MSIDLGSKVIGIYWEGEFFPAEAVTYHPPMSSSNASLGQQPTAHKQMREVGYYEVNRPNGHKLLIPFTSAVLALAS